MPKEPHGKKPDALRGFDVAAPKTHKHAHGTYSWRGLGRIRTRVQQVVEQRLVSNLQSFIKAEAVAVKARQAYEETLSRGKSVDFNFEMKVLASEQAAVKAAADYYQRAAYFAFAFPGLYRVRKSTLQRAAKMPLKAEELRRTQWTREFERFLESPKNDASWKAVRKKLKGAPELKTARGKLHDADVSLQWELTAINRVTNNLFRWFSAGQIDHLDFARRFTAQTIRLLEAQARIADSLDEELSFVHKTMLRTTGLAPGFVEKYDSFRQTNRQSRDRMVREIRLWEKNLAEMGGRKQV